MRLFVHIRCACLDMKVEFGEGPRESGVVSEDREIHGYGGGAGVARSEAPSSNRAVAVVQQQGKVGGASSSDGLANGRVDEADAVGRIGLRNALRVTEGPGEGAAFVTVQHGRTIVEDTIALVGSGKYRQQQVGENFLRVFFFCFSRADSFLPRVLSARPLSLLALGPFYRKSVSF